MSNNEIFVIEITNGSHFYTNKQKYFIFIITMKWHERLTPYLQYIEAEKKLLVIVAVTHFVCLHKMTTAIHLLESV